MYFFQGNPILYWSNRIGKNGLIFSMPKFRTMSLNAPEVATHMLNDPDIFLTPVGRFLRKNSLDELPQIWSVIIGNMNFVGPRPALFNQDDLIKLRIKEGVDKLVPGVTGWAQINGLRGTSEQESIMDKRFQYDLYYIKNWTIVFDIYIIIRTVFVVILSKVD